MDTTIRNLDPAAYRALKARAALAGRTVGDMMNEAIRAFLARPAENPGTASLRDITPEPYPRVNARLSEQIDVIVYGSR